MIKPGHFSLLVLISITAMANAQAASLDKYGNNIDSAPSQQTLKSSREIAIERAVQDIQKANPEKRKKLIREYSSRAKAALNKGNDDEARFYNEILTRSGN